MRPALVGSEPVENRRPRWGEACTEQTIDNCPTTNDRRPTSHDQRPPGSRVNDLFTGEQSQRSVQRLKWRMLLKKTQASGEAVHLPFI